MVEGWVELEEERAHEQRQPKKLCPAAGRSRRARGWLLTGKAGNRIQVYGIQYAGLGARTQDQDQMSTLEQKQDTGPGIRPEHRNSFWTKTQDQKARQDTRNRTEPMAMGQDQD